MSTQKQIHILPDCGNAPTKQLIQDLYSDIFNASIATFIDVADEGIIWEQTGNKQVGGKKMAADELRKYPLWDSRELSINSIITHGPEASVSGVLTDKHQIKYAFCDVFRFKSAGKRIIVNMKSFLIKL